MATQQQNPPAATRLLAAAVKGAADSMDRDQAHSAVIKLAPVLKEDWLQKRAALSALLSVAERHREAFPAIVLALQTKSRSARHIRTIVAQALTASNYEEVLVEGLRSSSTEVQEIAANGLLYGALSETAVERLLALSMSEDLSVATAARRTLLTHAQEIRPWLVRHAQQDSSWKRRLAACRILSKGAQDWETLAVVAKADPVTEVRIAAAEGLEFCGESRRVLPILLSLLDDREVEIRAAAARVIGKIAPSPDAVLPFLRRAVRDPARQVRLEAALALLQIAVSRRSWKAFDAMACAMRDRSLHVRRGVIAAVAKSPLLPEQKGVLIPALLENLRCGDRKIVALCLQELSMLAQFNASIPPIFLEKLLKDPRADIREEAARSLRSINSVPITIARALKAALRDPNQAVRAAAGVSLVQKASSSEEARKMVLAALRDPEEAGPVISAMILDPPNFEGIAPALLNLIDAGPETLREAAIRLLGKLPPEAEGENSLVSLAAFAPAETTRVAAIEALGSMGSESGWQVLRALAQWDPSPKVRRAALLRLPPEFADVLVGGLSDVNRDVQGAAAFAIGKWHLTGEAGVIQKLLQAARNGVPEAIWALGEGPIPGEDREAVLETLFSIVSEESSLLGFAPWAAREALAKILSPEEIRAMLPTLTSKYPPRVWDAIAQILEDSQC